MPHNTKSRKREKSRDVWNSEAAEPLEARYYLEEELEEKEESLTARAGIHWDEASADGEGSEEELEMTEGEDNMELLRTASYLYHYEADSIVQYCCSRKWYARENCQYTLDGLRKTAPAALCSVSSATIYWHYLDH